MANNQYNRLMEVDSTPMVPTSHALPRGYGNPIVVRERAKERTIELLKSLVRMDGFDTHSLCLRAAELRQSPRTDGVIRELVEVQLKLIHLLTSLQVRQNELSGLMKTLPWAEIDIVFVHEELIQHEAWIALIRKELQHV